MMADVIPLNAWKGKLSSSKQGFKKNMTNLILCLQHIKELGNTIKWNELAQRVEWNGVAFDERQIVDVRLILEAHEYEPTVSDLFPAVLRHAHDNSYHPVRDYLRSLKWDGTPRLDYWLQQCLGATDTPFNRLVGRKTLIAAVARAMEPGCKVDTVLVLEGEQGIKKSSAIAALFGEDVTAESVNLFDKHNHMVMSMMGAWVVELAEFVAFFSKDKSAVKGMLSMRKDKVVLPYAKLSSEHPRQCIFFGTINPGDSGYLTDDTGNRRYWPVTVTKADLDLIAARRDQIWAEAVKAYFAREPWWLEGREEQALAQDVVSEREEYDVWDEILHEKLIANNIASTTVGAALHAIGVPNERMDKKALNRAAASLRRLGYTQRQGKERGQDGKRKSVRVFVRDDAE